MNPNQSVRAGAIAWIAAVGQFIVVMLVVQVAWKGPYSWADNYISDLGNVQCGEWDGRSVCSPLHGLMNMSLTLGGALIIVGVLLTDAAWPRTTLARTIRSLLVATGGGWMVAGLSPADVNEDLHLLGGAFVIFAGGNLALLLTAFLRSSKPINNTRRYAGALGGVGLIGIVLHLGGNDLGLGLGGTERMTAYALPIWLLIAGTHLLRASRLPRGTSRPERSRLYPVESGVAPSRRTG